MTAAVSVRGLAKDYGEVKAVAMMAMVFITIAALEFRKVD